MKHDKRNTILFNIAGLTLIKLSFEDHGKVYKHIVDDVSKYGEIKGADREYFLTSYYEDQMAEHFGLNWVDLISVILTELNLVDKYTKK